MRIADVNSTLENYLFNQLDKLDTSVLDFSFKLPNKDWVTKSQSSINWINIYLIDLKENLELRRNEWQRRYENGQLREKKQPLYIDLYYLITFYNKEKLSVKEHEYLELVLLALSDFSNLVILPDNSPDARTVNLDLVNQMVIELFPKPYSDELGFQLWTALDQDARPFIPIKVTIPLESEVSRSSVPVQTKEIFYVQDEVTYNLKGKVLVQDTKTLLPASASTIKIKNKGGDVIDKTVADSLGKFEFKELKDEELVAVVEVEGYVAKEVVLDDLSKPIEIIVDTKLPQP